MGRVIEVEAKGEHRFESALCSGRKSRNFRIRVGPHPHPHAGIHGVNLIKRHRRAWVGSSAAIASAASFLRRCPRWTSRVSSCISQQLSVSVDFRSRPAHALVFVHHPCNSPEPATQPQVSPIAKNNRLKRIILEQTSCPNTTLPSLQLIYIKLKQHW